jgi:hypothetical protein
MSNVMIASLEGSNTATIHRRFVMAAAATRPASEIAQWRPVQAEEEWAPSTREQRVSIAAQHKALLHGEWEQHPRWRRGVGRHLVEDVHSYFRSGFLELVRDCDRQREKGVEKVKVDVKGFSDVLRHLEHHHRAEDRMFFPQLQARDADLKPLFDYLSLDHRHLHPLEEKVLKHGDEDALREFVSFLMDHLNREEMIIVPLDLAGRIHGFG